MELGPRVFWIILAKIEHNLEGIVANLEVVGIFPFEPAGLLRVLICISHRYHQVTVSHDGTISHAQEIGQHHVSYKSKFHTSFCWYGLCSSHHGAVTGEISGCDRVDLAFLVLEM